MARFGLSTRGIGLTRFLDVGQYDVYAFGKLPVAIAFLTSVKGLAFAEACERSIVCDISSVETRILHFDDLIKAKAAANMPRDLDDIERLRKAKP